MEGDNKQEAPLLANPCRKDPYSLQLSLVFPDNPDKQLAFKQFIEQTVREETPAHLTPYVHWLDKPAMTAFEAAYQNWLTKQRDYWADKTTHIPLRDARDRLIDLLQIG